MSREKIAWLTSVGLMALLAFQLPGSLAQRDDEYGFVRTLVDIQRRVSDFYVEEVDASRLRQAAIRGMLADLDPFTDYIPPDMEEDFERMIEATFRGVGVQLNQTEAGAIEVVTPIDGSPAFHAGVSAGDVIIRVNGESVEGLRLSEVIEKVQGPLGSEVTLGVRRNGEEHDLTMTRQEVVVPTVRGYSRNADNTWNYFARTEPKIAYVRLTQFTQETHDRMNEVLAELIRDGMQGLILDLRFNPGGHLEQAGLLVDLFLDQGTIYRVKGRARPEQTRPATSVGTLPDFPMVVLVNEYSASASEIVAGSLMDNRRALVIGMRTYGKGSVQDLMSLDGGGRLKMTVAYYYLPSGRLVHRLPDAEQWGVDPHIAVSLEGEAQRAAMRQRHEMELHHRPPADGETNENTAARELIDPQLQRGIDSLVGLVVLKHEPAAGREPPPADESAAAEANGEQAPEAVEQ